MGYDNGGNCDGFMLPYVDDMLGGGDRRPGRRREQVTAEVKSEFELRKRIEDDSVDRCGSDLVQALPRGATGRTAAISR